MDKLLDSLFLSMSAGKKKNSKKLDKKTIIQVLAGKNINQIVKLVCGEMLGYGLYRDVYVLKQNPNFVVKIERDPGNASFTNVTEFRNYIDNQKWEFLSDWMAPCELINETGQVMIQRRIMPGKRKDYPKEVPIFFTDLKLTNGGWIDGKFCFCDYAFLLLCPNNPKKNNMKYAKWWGTLSQPIRKK